MSNKPTRFPYGVLAANHNCMVKITRKLSPVAVAANTTAEQVFSIPGVLEATDTMISVSKPTAQAGLGIVGWWVSSDDHVGITFSNNTASPITPTGPQNYKITVLREPVPEPPPPYHADAVHFDGDALLSIASLTATNNAFCSIAFWFKCTFAESTGRSHWMTDPDTNANNVSFSYNVGGNRGWSVQFNNTSTGNLVVSTNTGLADGVWYCVVASFDTNHIAGARKYKIYVNDVDMTTLDTDAGPAFTMLFNALGMTVGGDGGSGYIGDMAEFRFMPGVSLLDGSGDIPQATRRLFRDAGGKPVDPATATSTLGAPCILFSGDATGFGTNQGTGGAFTLTGTLTDATTSPSD